MTTLLNQLQHQDRGRLILYSFPPKVPFTAAQFAKWKLDGTWTAYAWHQQTLVGQFSIEGTQLIFTDHQKMTYRGAIQPENGRLVLVHQRGSWSTSFNLTLHSDGELRGTINVVDEEEEEDDLFTAIFVRQ